MKENKKNKIAVIITHPIYYYVPIFRLLHNTGFIDITALYFTKFGITESLDKEFNLKINWLKELDLLSGYQYKFFWNLFGGKTTPSLKDFAPGIIKEILFGDYDYFWIVNWNTITHWLAIFFLILFKKKIILRAESPYNQEIKKSKFKLLFKKIILSKIFFPRVEYFLYIGEENRKFYEFYGVPANKLIFAPYSVDNDYFQKQREILLPQRDTLREDFGINKDDIVILFVGKLINKKRPVDLLFAYEKLYNQENIKNVTLIYVGDGELKNEMEKFIKDKNLTKVMLVGFKNQKELPIYYTISDIFVLPSGIGETWGLVVNEAMNFGLPIIVSDLVGCSTDLVKNSENGYSYPCGDIDKLSSYLKDLILNSEKRKNFGNKSRSIILNYTFEKVVDNLVANFRLK